VSPDMLLSTNDADGEGPSSGGDYGTLRRKSERMNSALEQHFWRCVVVFLAVLLACSVLHDLNRKLWLDEFFTLYVARQGSPTEIVKATMEGADATPPLYPILVSWVLPIVRHDALAVRLLSTLGFCVMIACVMAFCRRRMPAAYAIIAGLSAAAACAYYATEGRCYGMVLGCAAGALLCWQAATDGKHRVLAVTLLGVSLMMTALHYYSIFYLMPLALAEVVRWRRSKKMDYAVLGAMAPAVMVLVLHYPLIAAGERCLPHFWPDSIASWHHIIEFYGKDSLIPYCIFLVAVVVFGILRKPSAKRETRQLVLLPHEWVAMVTLVLMPLVVIAVAKYTIHVFLNRYALWALIGLAVLTAALLCLTSRDEPAVGLAGLALLVSILVDQQAYDFRQWKVLREGEVIRREIQLLKDGPEPVLIGYERIFMELSYYAEPRLRERIVYPLSRSLDLRYRGSDVNFLQLRVFRDRTKLRIVDLNEFLAANPRFIIATSPQDYLPLHLRTAGYRLVPMSSEGEPVLYEVEASSVR
jgi:hypothetical protein